MVERFGYCCINLTLSKEGLKVNRGITRKTFEREGIHRCGELALQNLSDMFEILKWNIKNNIRLYRMSSSMFPWMSEYQFSDLPQWNEIQKILLEIGQFSDENDIRLTFHPGHFCVLGSINPKVVENSINEINKHAEIMDLMGLPRTPWNCINIHINNINPNKEQCTDRFIEGFLRLSESSKRRLTIENDDSPNQYSVLELKNFIYSKIGIPIVMDFLHFKFGPKDQSLDEAIETAISTWPKHVTPLFHFASTRRFEDPNAKEIAHADYIWDTVPTINETVHIEIEAKAKELALLKLLEEINASK